MTTGQQVIRAYLINLSWRAVGLRQNGFVVFSLVCFQITKQKQHLQQFPKQRSQMIPGTCTERRNLGPLLTPAPKVAKNLPKYYFYALALLNMHAGQVASAFLCADLRQIGFGFASDFELRAKG